MSHFQQHNAAYNSVEEELWLIFTFYSLHFDPTMPEHWKSSTFVKFARDCQIIDAKNCHITSSSSGNLSVPILELEIAKLAKNKYTLEVEKDYNPSSINIDFSDFLSLISNVSTKVYSRDSQEVATRRILLENVLPLANRRTLLSLRYDSRDQEAWAVIKQYQKGLRHIFTYYLSKAEIRRNAWVADQVALVSKLIGLGPQISPAIFEEEKRRLRQMKEVASQQRDLISYKEYMTFCQDFYLKATAFLTSLQAADIFLQVVPLDPDLKSTKGMNFDSFLESLVYMAHLAFRTLSTQQGRDERPDSANRMRALLLYMWKAINNHGRNSSLMQEHVHEATMAITPSGTHDIFGSGIFSESFLQGWQRDCFREYSLANTGKIASSEVIGLKVIQSISTTADEHENSLITSANVGELEKERLANTSNSQLRMSATATGLKNDRMDMNELSDVNRTSDHITLRSSHLADLFALRPELAEYVYLEIQRTKRV